ncbi:MAG: NosD domain-containing protein [Bacteroidia bacterium]
MSGAYTIGRYAADYENVGTAVADLKSNGVCGPVVFHVEDGVYNGSITIPAINGASNTNTITIEGANGNNSFVTISTTSSATDTFSYIWKLDGASHFILKHLTFARNGSERYCTNVILTNGASNNQFLNNRFLGSMHSKVIGNSPLLLALGGSNNFNILQGNDFENLGEGVRIEGSNLSYDTANVISGNSFYCERTSPVYMIYQHQLVIEGNFFDYKNPLSGYSTLKILYTDGSLIIKDNDASGGGEGLIIMDHLGDSASPSLIANNAIVGNYITFRVERCHYIDIVNNTIKGNSKSLYLRTSGHINIFNNNLMANYNDAYEVWNDVTDLQSDHNNIYAGGRLLYYHYLSKNSIAEILALGIDSHSVSVAPQFVNPDNLRPLSDVDLNGAGTPWPGISSDLDGNVRNSLHPDIGAFEFDLPDENITITGYNYESSHHRCEGFSDIKINVRNFGGETITTFKVQWEVNGVRQPDYSWNGTLNSGDTAQDILIGSHYFDSDTAYDLLIWTSDPNQKQDAVTKGDTLWIPNVRTRMSGNYTIGGHQPHYTSFTAAVNDLDERGICGPVTFEVRTGFYEDDFTIPKIDGATDTSWITFRGESEDSTGAVLFYSGNEASDGGEYLHFEKLTFTGELRYASGNNQILLPLKFVKNVTINNCAFIGDLDGIALSLIGSHQIKVKDSYFYGCNDGITGNVDAFTIDGCIFDNQQRQCLALSTANSGMVTNNHFRPFRNVSFNNKAVQINGNKNLVENNQMVFNGIYGFHLAGSRPVFRNNIVTAMNTGQTYCYGGGSNSARIYNNTMISYGNSVIYKHIGEYNVNNIYVNLGGGKISDEALYYFYTKQSDYNVYYTTGSQLFHTVDSLQGHINASQLDSHSIHYMPAFIGNTGLIDYDSSLAKAGDTINFYADIFGAERDSSQPDIGAHQFSADGNWDAGIVWVNKPHNDCHGYPAIKVKIRNFGMDTLKFVRVSGKVNTLNLPAKTYKLNLPPGDTTGELFLAEYSFSYDTLYTLKLWSDFASDANRNNDTLTTLPFYNRMAGSYTIGGKDFDFRDLVEAAHTLESLGICDSVIFNMRNGTYEQNLTINRTPGAGPAKRVIFQSEMKDSSLVNIIFSNRNQTTLVLNNVHYLEFHHLGILNNYYGNNQALKFNGHSNHFAIYGCLVEGEIEVASNSTLSHSIFTNSRFFKGEMMLNGIDTSVWSENNIIRHNTFEDVLISMDYQRALVFTDNTLSSIEMSSLGDSVFIERNKIHGGYLNNRGFIGYLQLDGSVATPQYPVIITNNFIGGADGGLLRLDRSDHVKIYHNTIFNGDVYLRGTGIDFQNNIVDAGNASRTLLETRAPITIFSDFNIYYSSDTLNFKSTGSFSGSKSLTTWRSITGLDANSRFIKSNVVASHPKAINSNDLHIIPNSLVRLTVNNSISSVATDIDGNARPLSSPHAGAHEYHPQHNNAEAVSVDSPGVACSGTHDIWVTIANHGLDTLKQLRIQYEVNDSLQVPFNWQGALASSDSQQVKIGSVAMRTLESISVRAWSELPNNAVDSFAIYDTTKKVVVPTAISGTYTVGHGGDFNNLIAACEVLNYRGICGPVVLNVLPGRYYGGVALVNVRGTSPQNTITIQSIDHDSTSVTLEYAPSHWLSSENHILKISGTNYVRVKHLTFDPISDRYAQVLVLENSGHDLVFQGNIFHGREVAGSHDKTVTQEPSNQYYFSNVKFLGNMFLGSPDPFKDFTCDNATFSFNKFVNSKANISFRGNNFQFISNTLASGIYLSLSDSFLIKGNFMKGISSHSPPLVIYRSSNGIITNNFLNFELAQIYASTIRVAWSNNIEIIYNTISGTSYDSQSATLFIDTLCSNISFYNNQITEEGSGYVLMDAKVRATGDYNNLYSRGGKYAYVGGQEANSLAELQSFRGTNLNSLSEDPRYLSDSVMIPLNAILQDKGTPSSTVMDDYFGNVRSTSTPDIGAYEYDLEQADGGVTGLYSQHKTPCQGVNTIYARIRNYGVDTLKSLVINWQANDTAQTSVVWTGALAPGLYKDSIVVGFAHATEGLGIEVMAWTSAPNAQRSSQWFAFSGHHCL